MHRRDRRRTTAPDESASRPPDLVKRPVGVAARLVVNALYIAWAIAVAAG